MKIRILVVALLQLFMVLGSCSNPESEPGIVNPDEEGQIKADYYLSGFTDDFIVSNDNTVYKLEHGSNAVGGTSMVVNKVDPQGKETKLRYLDLSNFFFRKVCNV